MSEETNQHFPFKIKDVEPSIVEELLQKFPTGTTLTAELVWLVENGFDYKIAADTILNKRFPFLESSVLKGVKEKFEKGEERQSSYKATENLHKAPSPRFIKTHLPLSLLPPALADTARVVYVARDPRDVAVSLFHLHKSGIVIPYNGDFKTYWNYFINDLRLARNHNKGSEISGKANHGQTSGGTGLANHLQIDKFKKNRSVNLSYLIDAGLTVPDEMSFIRRGKVGGWRDYFDEEMTRQAEHWIAENLRGTDLRFPSMDEP